MRYGVRIHDRLTDDDPHIATVMYTHGEDGPWFDMASGEPDHVWDILGALQWRDEALRNREERDRERLAAEVDGTPRADIVDLLRGPVEDSDLCWDAAAEIERLRAAGDVLANRLRWWTDGTDEAYPDHQTLQTWQEARRG